MTQLQAVWPFALMFTVVGGLAFLAHTHRYRPPLPVLTTAQLPSDSSAEMLMLADVVRSGAFYVSGVVLDWAMCCEFATKVVDKAHTPDVDA